MEYPRGIRGGGAKTGSVHRCLNHGADVNQAASDGETPLHAACWKNHVDIARLLLERRAAVDPRDENGWTPLFICCFVGRSVKMARLLLDHNAEVEGALPGGLSSLHIACAYDHVDEARLCLERGTAAAPKSSVSDDPLPRNIHVVAAASPRLVSKDYPRHLARSPRRRHLSGGGKWLKSALHRQRRWPLGHGVLAGADPRTRLD